MTESEEEEYDKEFARLMREGTKCPICGASAARIEGVQPGYSAWCECSNGHTYLLMDADHE